MRQSGLPLISTDRPSLKVLVLGWLAFVLVPGLFVWTSLNHALEFEEEHIRKVRSAHLIQEIEAFRRELNPGGFLERSLRPVLRSIWNGPLGAGKRLGRLDDPTARSALRSNLETRVGFPILGLVWHDQGMRECWIDQHPAWQRPIPKRALLRFLQDSAERLSSSPHSSLRQEKEFLPLVLGDVVRARLVRGKTVAILTRQFGGGRVFLLYLPLEPGSGCLVVVRESDLSPRELLRRVAGAPLNPGIRRGWSVLSPRLAKQFMRRTRSLPIVEGGAGMLRISARPSPWFSTILATRGGFAVTGKPQRLIIKASASPEAIGHPLRPLLSSIGHGILLLASVGTMVLLYLGLFGFGVSLRLSGKILIGAGVAAVFPLIMLTIGGFLYQRIQESRQENAVLTRLSFNQQLVERMLRNHLLEVSRRFQAVGKALQPVVHDGIRLEDEVGRLARSLPIRDLYCVAGDGRAFSLQCASDANTINEPIVVEMIKTLTRAFLEGIRSDSGTQAKEVTIQGIPLDLNTVGDFLARPGLISPYRIANREQFFSTLPLFGRTTASGTRSTGVVMARFSEAELLKDFLKQQRELLAGLQDRIADWDIRCAIISPTLPEDGNEATVLWSPDGSRRPFFRQFAEMDLVQGETLSTSLHLGSTRTIVSAFRLPRFSGLVVAWGESPVSAFPLWTVVLVGTYFGLLVLCVNGLLHRFFHEPIGRLNAVADQIAGGAYPERIGVDGSDEIGRLGTAFGELIQVLRHRDELSHFVSDEVMAAVQDDNESGLARGGELTEVTVLFAGLRGFREWSETVPPERAVQVLDTFLEAGEACVRNTGGSLDKIVEETLMGVFRHRPGEDDHDHALRAVQAALALRDRIPERIRGLATGDLAFPVDIGIASGTVLSGRIGSGSGILDFSVIGNAVNLASRFKGQAKKAVHTGIMIAPSTIKLVQGRVKVAFVERVQIKGRSRSFSLYEVLGIRESPGSEPSFQPLP